MPDSDIFVEKAAYEVDVFELGAWSVSTTTRFGPRILNVQKAGSPPLLATLDPEVKIDRDGGDPYRFWGGHRLWASPEVPAVTYAPEDHDCLVTFEGERISILGQEDAAGLQKRLEAYCADGVLVVRHHLVNSGASSLEVSSWAITQFRMGGVGLLPLGYAPEPDGLQADRHLVVWPYTRLDDARLEWSDSGVSMRATPGPRLKLGSGPAPARLAYLWEEFLFTKTVTPVLPHGRYADLGAVGQIFVDDNFFELETIGPLARLDPGDAISSTETWDIVGCADLSAAWEVVGR